MAERWITRTVVGIVIATFFSDVGHEMATAVLPLYLGSIGLGAAALGVMEGIADLAFSLSKLAGGVVGHRVQRKRPLIAAGYLLTSIGVAAIGLVRGVAAVTALRGVAWLGRGFRSPLRDFLLADEVAAAHFGRAYGIERSADMLGALAGPLVAAALVWSGLPARDVILWSVVPSLISVAAIVFMTRDRTPPAVDRPEPMASRGRLPRAFWWFVAGVLLFGLGDFSRAFLILLGASALGDSASGLTTSVLTTAVLIYAGHNLVSAIAAYPAGRLGDAWSRPKLLVIGYALGVVTNATLAIGAGDLAILIPAIALSGIYIAIEETLEKSVVAGLLSRDLRSLGLGILAAANAIGDLGSSIFVGFMLDAGHTTVAFAVPACVGAAGVAWLAILIARRVV